MNLFTKLGIANKVANLLEANGIQQPTEIQERTIPLLLQKKEDFIGVGKTGTGKTLAYALPLLNLIDPILKETQAIVLVPTRELAQQVSAVLEMYSKAASDISVVATYGGNTVKSQAKEIKGGAQIIVATPGRLVDLLEKEIVTLKNVSHLVLDEADEMLVALKEDFLKIHEQLPKQRRTWLFTATMASEVKNIVHNYMAKDHLEITIDTTAEEKSDLIHQYVVVDPIEKLDVLFHFLNSQAGKQGIIFCRTKAAVNKLAKNLAISKFSSGALHGSLAQPIRERVMDQFKEGHLSILVATDLAARGLDVVDLGYVVNYHLPEVEDTYVHRSGRTARAGSKGLSFSILQQEELKEMAEFQLNLGIQFEELGKPSKESVEENNMILWAKRVLKTKINHELSPALKSEVNKVFKHLSKEELIDKLLSNVAVQTKAENPNTDKIVKKVKKKR